MKKYIQEDTYLGDIHVICREDISTNFIKYGELNSLEELNDKIERWIKNYRLDILLLKIHDATINRNVNNFVAAMVTRYALLNSSLYTGFDTISDDEFIRICRMVAEYVMYDPEFEENYDTRRINTDDQEKQWASFFLRKFGSQTRFNVPRRNLFGRMRYLYDVLLYRDDVPKIEITREFMTLKFKDKFGISAIDFINIGYILCAASRGSTLGLDRGYFDGAREKGICVPDDGVVKVCLEHVTCNTKNFKDVCIESDSFERHLRAYKLNPLFSYPLIRPWYGTEQMSPNEDRFIAPVQDLLIYRFTTGLYYQLFDEFSLQFSSAFGYLFEAYVGEVLNWCHYGTMILSERDVKEFRKTYGKRNNDGKIPDWIVLCDEGIILIECKATKYTQDIYEHGLDANAKGCFDQIETAIAQLNEFEAEIPDLIKAVGASYGDLQIQKIIITFESLVGLVSGPIRNRINNNLLSKGFQNDWKILWIWYLEDVQPYIAKGASLWSFLIDLEKLNFDIDKIEADMNAKTGASYSDDVLYKYEMNIFDELTNNGAILRDEEE